VNGEAASEERVSAESFERRYCAAEDPWSYRSSHYERGKYRCTLNSLKRKSYARIFEPGCSIGELTAGLAQRCERLLATDISPSAVRQARRRCQIFPHVQIECEDLRETQPRFAFDLIVLSEIGYYFDRDMLLRVSRRLSDCLMPGGELIAVHWLGTSPDHLLHADNVHALLLGVLSLDHVQAAVHPGFRVDSWIKR
jgi:cyclopropane fatty-acyl-phospholipid synthase-like methyltransferase